MSEHTRIKLNRSCKRPKYRETRNCKKHYKRGSCKVSFWIDNYTDISISYLVRYLQSNIGKPYNKVYSKLVNKVKSSHIPVFMLNRALKVLIVNKKEYSLFHPSFYITNGILNINRVKNKKKNI